MASLGIQGAGFWLSTPFRIIALIEELEQIEKFDRVNLAVAIAHCMNGGEPAELLGQEPETSRLA